MDELIEVVELIEFFKIGLDLDEFGYLVNLGELGWIGGNYGASGEITVHREELR